MRTRSAPDCINPLRVECKDFLPLTVIEEVIPCTCMGYTDFVRLYGTEVRLGYALCSPWKGGELNYYS